MRGYPCGVAQHGVCDPKYDKEGVHKEGGLMWNLSSSWVRAPYRGGDDGGSGGRVVTYREREMLMNKFLID